MHSQAQTMVMNTTMGGFARNAQMTSFRGCGYEQTPLKLKQRALESSGIHHTSQVRLGRKGPSWHLCVKESPITFIKEGGKVSKIEVDS